jgi:hypothetical protein
LLVSGISGTTMMPAGHALPGNYSVQRSALMVMGSSRFMLKLLMPSRLLLKITAISLTLALTLIICNTYIRATYPFEKRPVRC